MTAFEPTTQTIHPLPEADPLGSAVIAAFSRELVLRLTMPVWLTLLLGVVTAGLGPLIVLLLRFRTFATAQAFQLEHVDEWIQNRSADHELRRATQNLRARWGVLIGLGLLIAIVAFGFAIYHFWREGLTFDAIRSLFSMYRPGNGGFVYGVLITTAYLFHVLAIYLFSRRVSRWMDAFELRDPGIRGIAWSWPVGGVALAVLGAGWGLAMMLAAGVHRRYISETSREIRDQVATRMKFLVGKDSGNDVLS